MLDIEERPSWCARHLWAEADSPAINTLCRPTCLTFLPFPKELDFLIPLLLYRYRRDTQPNRLTRQPFYARVCHYAHGKCLNKIHLWLLIRGKPYDSLLLLLQPSKMVWIEVYYSDLLLPFFFLFYFVFIIFISRKRERDSTLENVIHRLECTGFFWGTLFLRFRLFYRKRQRGQRKIPEVHLPHLAVVVSLEHYIDHLPFGRR